MQTTLGLVEVAIVGKHGPEARAKARLVGADFPRVQKKIDWAAFLPVDAADPQCVQRQAGF